MAFVQSTVKKIADNVSGTQNFTAASNFTAGNDGFVTIQHFNSVTPRITGVTIVGVCDQEELMAVLTK